MAEFILTDIGNALTIDGNIDGEGLPDIDADADADADAMAAVELIPARAETRLSASGT